MSLQLYLGTVAIDAAMTAGSGVVTTAVAGAVVGMYADVLGAGPSGTTLVACVTAVGSGTVTLGYAASVTVTDATITLWKPYAVGRYSLSGEVSSLTNQPSMSFAADRVRNTAEPKVGQPVLVLDLALAPTVPSASTAGDIFGGSINSVDITQIPGNANATYDCACVSWEQLAARHLTGQPNDGTGGQPINGKFSGMAAGAVFEWLCEHTELKGDISAVSVVTGPSIPEISFDYTDDASAFDGICQASGDGTNTYIWRADCRRNFYFELQTTNAAPWNVSNSDALTGCTYSHTLEKFANSATVTPQNSTGDTIDSTLVRTYDNATSIDERSGVEGGTGYHEIAVAQGSANSSMDATTLAESVAKTYGVVPATVQYSTYRGGLRAGHLQTIVISDLGVSGTFLIDSVSLSMSNGAPLWQIHAVDGALIGDWRTALANLAAGTGFSSISGGNSDTFYTDAIVAGHISPDLANGFNHQVFLVSGSAITVDNLVWTGGTIAAGQNFTLAVYQDATGSRPTPTFGTGYTGTSGHAISTDPLSVSTFYFRYDGTHFALIGFSAGSGTTGGTATPPPAQPTAVSGAEVGSRSLEQPLQRTVLTVRASCTLAGGSTADRARVWLSTDGGGSWDDQGEFPFAPGVPHIDFPAYAPTSAENWYVRVSLGNVGGYSDPATARTSLAFTVAAIAPPSATLGTTLTIPTGAGGTWPYDTTLPNGHHYWIIPEYAWDDSPRDSSTFFYRVTAEDLGAGGVSVRGEEPTSGTMISPGGRIQTASLMGEYGRAGNGANRTGDIEAVKLRLYVCSRVDESTNAFSNTAASTLLDTKVVTVAVGAAIPVDVLNAKDIDPSTLGQGFIMGADGKPRSASSNAANLAPNGEAREGTAGWTFTAGSGNGGLGFDDATSFLLQPRSDGSASITEIGYHACVPGVTMYASCYIRSSAGITGNIQLMVAWLDSSGAVLSVGGYATFAASGSVGATWTKIQGTLTAPANTANMRVWVLVSGAQTSGYIWLVDNVWLEQVAATGAGAAINPTTGALDVLLGTEFGLDGSNNIKLASVDFTKAAAGTFSSEFQVTSGTFKMKSIAADIIATGVLEVGGANSGSTRVSRFKVFDTASPTANLIGWIGDDSAGSGYVGAWFKRCLIGGTSPATAKIVADASGNVAINGNLIVNGTVSLGALGTGTLPVGITYAGTVLCSQLGSGTLPIGVSYLGTVNCSQLTAGTITTVSLQCTSVSGSSSVVASVNSGNYSNPFSIAHYSSGVLDNVVSIDPTGVGVSTSGGSWSALGSTGLSIRGNNVVGQRQTGPGVISFGTVSDVAAWCGRLQTALQNHGLIT